MGYAPKKPELVGRVDGRPMAASQMVKTVAGSSRQGAICAGMIGVIKADGTVDAPLAADLANGGTLKLVWIDKLFNSNYVPLKSQKRSSTEAGLAHVLPLKGVVIRMVEDGVGGFLDSSNWSGGSIAGVPGTITSDDSTVTEYPKHYAGQKLDSSVQSDTAGHHPFNLLGKDPAIINDGKDSAGAAAAVTFLVQVADAFCADV